jgi:hypothetical protein
MILSTSEQKEQTEMLKHQRTSVSFSDDVTTFEIPRLDAGEMIEVHYSRSDYRKFQRTQQIRVDRQIAKQARRMIEDASASLEAHTLELAWMRTPVDDLLLVKPPTMPVRQASSRKMIVSDVSTYEVAFSEPPPVRRVSSLRIAGSPTPVALPVRQASRSRIPVAEIRPTNGKVSEPLAAPVRQDSKMKIKDMVIAQAALPESPRSRLDGALAA